MRKPYLIVDDNESCNHKYRLTWYFPEDSDLGGSLGDEKYTVADLETVGSEDRDCVVAYLAAVKAPGVENDHAGLFWETGIKARVALRIVKEALKVDTGAPMPDWATKAIGAGWKAPKGWKP